ncbi:unnamed protein product [Fraxinus pennsylvanica]|uniref:Response regulatory domain-containing protein n=1 Tax=Fraxinus pennsylvanica TaxID=56036 RepID=A0AAD1YXT2_9LAMI|nr:unnamed protein product [Fraxinus pennsylvanica]
MWKLGGFQPNDGRNVNPMASYREVMSKVHVLLVDHDSDCSISTTKMLELCSYKVTCVELASIALSLLSSRKTHFDIVLANINSPDLQGYKLLQQAVNMDIPVILMSIDDNAFLAMGALEKGAFLFIKKPVTMDMLKCLWQHVVREKIRVYKEKERIIGKAATNNHTFKGIEFRLEVEEENNFTGGNNMKNKRYKGKNKICGREVLIGFNSNMKNNRYKGKNKICGREVLIGFNKECESQHQLITSKAKSKECIEWTEVLHRKFIDALGQLGEGRCFPKDILELMDVPGLTRMQVSSHLQKFRNDTWRAPVERKFNQNNALEGSTDSNISGQNKSRRFGSMPCLKKNSLLINDHSETQEGSEILTENEMPNDCGHGYENVTVEHHKTHEVAEVLTETEMSNDKQIMSSHQQHREQLLSVPKNARPGANSSSNPRFPSDDFFYFQDIDCMFSNFSGMQQGFGMDMNQSACQEAFHVNRVSSEQNSALPSVKTKNQWSSETSNFPSDSSETRGQEN